VLVLNSGCLVKIIYKGFKMAVQIDIEKCTGCGNCVEMCPVKAIKIDDNKAIVSDDCIECGVCINSCPVQAITI
jgi:NAD-dependent dihydropyrimidine dehydrogenase PreA subunit